MARKLKVYQTSLGFYDLAIAAPSMKAALKAWGASESPELFRQGFAQQSEDREVVAAAMARPGVVLRRPVGSTKPFQEQPELPTAESLSRHFRRTEPSRKKATAPEAGKDDAKAESHAAKDARREAQADKRAERKAAAAFEREERRRELRRQKEEAAAASARARRHAAIEKAKSALDKARREHAERTAAIEKDRAAIERHAKREELRWQKLASRLKTAVQKASR